MRIFVFFSGAAALSINFLAHKKQPSKPNLIQHIVQALGKRQVNLPVSVSSSTTVIVPVSTPQTSTVLAIGNSPIVSTTATLSVADIGVNLVSTVTSNTTNYFAQFTGSPTTAPNMNGYINYDDPDRPANQVDTVDNSWGIASTARVDQVRFHLFCSLTYSTRALCDAITNHVDLCAQPASGSSDECNDDYSRSILGQSVDAHPCETVDVIRGDALVQRVCALWYVEANRCAAQSLRGPCAGHHALYMLKLFSGLVSGLQADSVEQ